MVQRASQENQPKANGVSDITSPYLGTGPDHSMAFDIKDIADIAVPNVVPAEVSAKESNGKSSPRPLIPHVLTTLFLQARRLASRPMLISLGTWPSASEL
jgi:hypothetical protein